MIVVPGYINIYIHTYIYIYIYMRTNQKNKRMKIESTVIKGTVEIFPICN